MTHGYLLTGSGSNVYVRNLCRALVREGHEVHLLCQDPNPLAQDFVSEWRYVNGSGASPLGERETGCSARCVVYRPQIGDLLPVYVYDDYPGWRVKTFLDLTEDELQRYLYLNAAALRTVARESGARSVVTNHSLPGPLIARRALEGLGVPYLSIVHGSCLQYVARKSERYMTVAREGLEGARRVVSPSPHGAGTIAHDFPDLKAKTLALTGGVDTDLFRPDAPHPKTPDLTGGSGRGPEQRLALDDALKGATGEADLLAKLHEVSLSYEPRVHDSDAGERLERFLAREGREGPLVIYVGKLIHSKGVHALLPALARLRAESGLDARLLVVGFGTFREGLEALTRSLGSGDGRGLSRLSSLGRRLEGGPDEPLEYFGNLEHFGELSRSVGLAEAVEFVGPLEHAELAGVIPAADAAVVPSIFPEIFGLVAAEFAASGVVPFVADHSGLAEAGAVVGEGLPFDVRVGMGGPEGPGGFPENLAAALGRYLTLPEPEREECSRIVRSNAVRELSWDSLAREVSRLLE